MPKTILEKELKDLQWSLRSTLQCIDSSTKMIEAEENRRKNYLAQVETIKQRIADISTLITAIDNEIIPKYNEVLSRKSGQEQHKALRNLFAITE